MRKTIDTANFFDDKNCNCYRNVRLGDYVEFRRGTTITKQHVVPGTIPVIAGGKKPAYFHSIANRQRGCITVSQSGTAGYVAYHDKPIFASDCFTIATKTKNLEQMFLYYCLKSKQEQIYSLCSGGVQSHLYPRNLEDLEIPLPSLAEQNNILKIINEMELSISASDKVISYAERTKQSLMTKFLTGGLDRSKIESGALPDGWKRARLDQLARIVTGQTPKTSESRNWGGRIPFVTPSDLGRSVFVSETERKVTEYGISKSRVIPKFSLLFTCIASIGKSAINELDCVTNQQINSCCFRTNEETLFFYYQLRFRLEELKRMAGKTAVPIINKSKFSSFNVIYPPPSEQREIVEILLSFDKLVSKEDRAIERKRKVRDSAIKGLLSGKVRVPT